MINFYVLNFESYLMVAGAKMNGFGSGSSMWLSSFDLSTKDTPPQFDVMKKLNEVFKQVSPFYKQASFSNSSEYSLLKLACSFEVILFLDYRIFRKKRENSIIFSCTRTCVVRSPVSTRTPRVSPRTRPSPLIYSVRGSPAFFLIFK